MLIKTKNSGEWVQSEKLEVLSKESENTKNNRFKNTITEMKYTLEGINGRIN